MIDKTDRYTLNLFSHDEPSLPEIENLEAEFAFFSQTHRIISVDDVLYWGLTYEKDEGLYRHPLFGGEFILRVHGNRVT